MNRRLVVRFSAFLLLALPGCASRSPVIGVPAASIEPRTARSTAPPRSEDGAPEGVASSASADFAGVFFEYDSARLTPQGIERLREHLRILGGDPGLQIVVEGHCDERGTAEYNIGLGERRAEAVRSWLRDAGVRPEHLRILSYGKERPFATGHREEDWRQNRRAQLVAENR